jgi:hypothetical protein
MMHQHCQACGNVQQQTAPNTCRLRLEDQELEKEFWVHQAGAARRFDVTSSLVSICLQLQVGPPAASGAANVWARKHSVRMG